MVGEVGQTCGGEGGILWAGGSQASGSRGKCSRVRKFVLMGDRATRVPWTVPSKLTLSQASSAGTGPGIPLMVGIDRKIPPGLSQDVA